MCLPGALPALDPATSPENYIFASWDTEDGLPHDSVKQLFQSSDGYLWVGTQQGLARFDGLRFVVFQKADTPALASDRITALAETKDGTLWIGTDNGLARYRQGIFSAVTAEQGLRRGTINALCVLPDGSLVVGGREGIARFADGRFDYRFDTTGVNLLGLRSMFVDRSGTIWAAVGPEVLRFSDGRTTRFGQAQGLTGSAPQQFEVDPDGKLHVVTQAGIFQFQDDRFVPVRDTANLSTQRVNCMRFDAQGNLWVGSPNGLERVHQGAIALHKPTGGRTLGVVDAILEDRENCLWLGTSQGLYRLTDRRAYSIAEDSTLGLTVMQARDGSIWASTWGRGVDRLHEGTTKNYALRAPLSHESVTAIYQSPDGAMWLGNRGSSIDRLEGDKVKTYVYASGVVSSRPVTALWMDDDGTLLIGINRRGLLELRNDEISPVPDTASWASESVQKFLRTRDGRLFAGATHGLFERTADRSWHPVDVPGVRAPLSVRDITESEDGTLWIATLNQGLVRWRGAAAHVFGTEQGIIDNLLLGVVDDRLGSIWMVSSRGIARVRQRDFEAVASGAARAVNPLSLGRVDGLASAASSGSGATAVIRLEDGRLMFATNKGFAVVDPAALQTNTLPPTVVIEGLRGDELSLPPQDRLQLPAGTRRVEIRYTALSLVAPERLRFRYKLEGLDPTWIEAGHERAARYTQLPPGRYTFRVIACNNDGVWSEKGTALSFTMGAHYYQTLWFKLTVALAALGLIASGYGWRVRTLSRRQEELARINAELDDRVHRRTAELTRSRDELAQRESLFRLIFEHAPIGVLWHRADQGLQYHFNQAFRRILDLPAETLPDNSLLLSLVHPEDAARYRESERRMQEGEIDSYTVEQRFIRRDGKEVWALLAGAVVRDAAGAIVQVIGLLEDISARKLAEQELAQTHQRLVETSRTAGMAEVATSVLHEVGNVLNSVNVSAALLASGLQRSRVEGLGKLNRLLQENASRLASFLQEDPRGQHVLGYLDTLASHLHAERDRLLKEVEALRLRVEHINEIVARQQQFTEVSSLIEEVDPAAVVENALRLTAHTSAGRAEIVRDFAPVPKLSTDGHKLLQILVHLLKNAAEAAGSNRAAPGRIVVRLRRQDNAVAFAIEDNGVGISRENLTRIFAHGFTTKPTGHGFSLHASANAARELGGSLRAESAGLGHGATFHLTLPLTRLESPSPTPPARASVTPELVA